MSPKPAWDPAPHPIPPFTKEETFAYRLRKELWRAFWAGARYAASNPGVMERKPVAVSMLELSELPDFVGDEFNGWAARRAPEYDHTFGLSEPTISGYFPPPK